MQTSASLKELFHFHPYSKRQPEDGNSPLAHQRARWDPAASLQSLKQETTTQQIHFESATTEGKKRHIYILRIPKYHPSAQMYSLMKLHRTYMLLVQFCCLHLKWFFKTDHSRIEWFHCLKQKKYHITDIMFRSHNPASRNRGSFLFSFFLVRKFKQTGQLRQLKWNLRWHALLFIYLFFYVLNVVI